VSRTARIALLIALAATCSACSSGGGRSAAPAPTAPVETTAPEPTSPAPPTATPAPTPTPTPAPATSRRPSPAPTPRPLPHPVGTYAFPVAGCGVSYARSHHDYPATDIFAARGCAFVAVVAGRVDEVTYVDRWSSSTNRGADRGGLSVSIVGEDGVRYYGSHLSAIAPGIRPGVRVKAGTRLGSVGNTGSARGIATHVHFGVSWPTRAGIWWVRRGEVYPWPYLDSWRAGGDRSPAAAVAAARHRAGSDVPRCTSYC
jgi:murein DD-endopeptidase MepM/ murein hydrolase activator NlpD